MKRQFRILAGILSLVGCMAVFSGCKEETPPDPDAALKEDVLINGFEQWTPICRRRSSSTTSARSA